MKLVRLCLAWAAGIYLGLLWSAPVGAVMVACGWTVGGAFAWRRRGRMWAALCLGAFLCGLAWCTGRVTAPTLPGYTGRDLVMEGEVVRGTEYSDGGAWLGFSVRQVEADGCPQAVSGRVVVYTDPFPAYGQGDRLRITGEISPVSQVKNAGYRDFLVREGFAGTVGDGATVQLLGRSWLSGWRDRLARSLSAALAEPQASLAEGLLLGLRGGIPDDLRADFSRTGTSHLLAISGFNLAVIGGGVLSAAARLLGRRRPLYLLVTLVIVWVYSALTGLEPPVMRAAIMFSILLAGLWLGRPGSGFPALALSGAVMAGLDPPVLRDVSFQLSFMAVAGLMLVQPPLQRWGERLVPDGHPLRPVFRPLWNSLAVSLAAVLATLPLALYHFRSLSLVGLPATTVASFFVTGATVLAGATALLGLFVPALAWVAGGVASIFLMGIVASVEWFARLPLASLETGAMPAAAAWACYVVGLGVLWRCRLRLAAVALVKTARGWRGGLARVGAALDRLAAAARRLPRKRTTGILSVCACLGWAGFAGVPGTALEVSFLDVGQGDAVLVITAAGQQVLIDGGPDPDTVCQRLGEKLPFWDKTLDLVVLTHGHDDHLVGLLGVLQRYRVGRVLESGLGEGALYREWLTLVEEEGAARTIARAGQEIDLGCGVRLEVIHPSDDSARETAASTNSLSVVLRLVWGQASFLLPGDADQAAEREILYGGVVHGLDSDVLKLGHHGSSYSTSAELLRVVDPEVAVISVGEGNRFGHPSAETLARLDGLEVYRTDEHGTVTFTTDGERLWVSTARTGVP